jgi:hypothetical protein
LVVGRWEEQLAIGSQHLAVWVLDGAGKIRGWLNAYC